MAEEKVEYGIKETLELQKGLNKLIIKLAPLLVDGFQATDVIAGLQAINSDPIAKAELEAALADIKEVPKEARDLSWAEGAQIGYVQLKAIPEIIAAFKKV